LRMAMRPSLLVIVALAIVGCDSVEFAADDAHILGELGRGVSPLSTPANGQLRDSDEVQAANDKKVEHVSVPVVPGSSVPAATVKSLTPKHVSKEKAKWKQSNRGKKPTTKDEAEFARAAKVAAAAEIKKTQLKVDVGKKLSEKQTKNEKKIGRLKKNMRRVEANDKNAATTDARNAERKQKQADKANKKKKEKEMKANDKKAKAKFEADNADTLLAKTKFKLRAQKEKGQVATEAFHNAEDSKMKATMIIDKNKGLVSKFTDAAAEKEDFLHNIEEHEEAARTEKKEADIKVEFETADMRKVKIVLKRMQAKKAAVQKFTKTLDQKSQRDFKAATSAIAKAKGDYAASKSKYDKLTKEVAKHESKVTKTKKLIKMAVDGVLVGLRKDKDAKAIASAENDSYLQKRKATFQIDVDKEDVKAKGQQKRMNAARTELSEGLALETAARKQKERVKSERETMAAQVKKIKFLKNELKQNEARVTLAEQRAAAALKKVRTMRTAATEAREQAESKARYVKTIDLPLSKRALTKALGLVAEKKLQMNQSKDKIDRLKKRVRYFTKLDAKLQENKKTAKESAAKKFKTAQAARKKASKLKQKNKDKKTQDDAKLRQDARDAKKLEAKIGKKKKAEKKVAKKGAKDNN